MLGPQNETVVVNYNNYNLQLFVVVLFYNRSVFDRFIPESKNTNKLTLFWFLIKHYWYIYPRHFSKCRLQITINSSAVNCNDNYYLLDFFKKGSRIKCSSRIHSIYNSRLVFLVI